MEPLEAAITLASVLGFVCVVLLVYVLILSRENASLRVASMDWRDGFASEADRHQQTRAALRQLDLAHADLQADYMRQGRELTLAQAKAKAAERVE